MTDVTEAHRGRGSLLAGTALLAALLSAPAGAACPPAPSNGCKLAGATKLSIRNATSDDRDQFAWRWSKGEALSPTDIGDPIDEGTAYTLCLYSGAAETLVAEMPMPQGDGWKIVNSGGFLWNNPKNDGIGSVSAEPGERGKSSFAVKGKGAGLPLPDMPLELPVRAQLLADTSSLCLQTEFTAANTTDNIEGRFLAQAKAVLADPLRTIPSNDDCNMAGKNGSVATQVGAQMRRSGSEWATSCLMVYGAESPACEVMFPGNTESLHVPEVVPSLVCPGDHFCDNSLGRVEWHAQNKFGRKCSLDQWALVWSWIQERAGANAPPDCDAGAIAPGFWGVFTCYEQYFIQPLMANMLDKLRQYDSPHPPMTAACQGTIVARMWWRLASDWIRYGDNVCYDGYHDTEMQTACGTNGAAKIDEATWDAWCDEFSNALRPVYEGTRAASGKPY